MRNEKTIITFGAIAAACTLAACGAAWAASDKPAAAFDTAAIEELTGAKGALDAKEGVFKVSLPRRRHQGDRRGRADDAAPRSHGLGGVHQGGQTASTTRWSWATSSSSRTR